MYAKSSATSRDLPTPGSPTTVTSWTERSLATLSNVARRRVRSSSRPTRGVVIDRITSEPNRARGAIARQMATGSVFPLATIPDELLVVEDAFRRLIRRLPDSDAVDRGRGLDPGSSVDDISCRHPFATLGVRIERDNGLAGVHSDTHREGEPRIRLVQLLDRLEHRQARPDGPLRVVLVCDGSAEHRHDGIADELLDRAAISLYALARARVVRGEARLNLLRVGRLGRRREPDEVAEEHGDDLPLPGSSGGGSLRKRSAAVRAERKLAREILAACGARRHARESTTL